METTDCCSYELSKRLKDCGFDEPCDCHYTNGYANDSRVVKLNNGSVYYHNKVIGADGKHISAVPLWQAQKWLREKKHLSVEPYANIVANFNYNIADLESFADYKGQGIGYESYECALAAGISASLELIKKGE